MSTTNRGDPNVGRVVAWMLLKPRRLRGMAFEVQINTYSARGQRKPYRTPLPTAPLLIRTESLAVGRGGWRYSRQIPEPSEYAGHSVMEGVGPWWQLDEPGLCEHLDPALVLSSLYELEVVYESDVLWLRAKPRPHGDIDDAAALVFCDEETWQGRVDRQWGVLVDVKSWSDEEGGVRSVLQWRHEPYHQEQ